jgi:cbb3-type cytochrome oxidase maturation protein
MSILGILVPISLVLVGLAVWAFFWATNSGQFDDLDTPALDAILDEAPAPRARDDAQGTRSPQ